MDKLATTTLPFPTKCAWYQRTYARLRTKVSTWHTSVFPNRRSEDPGTQPEPIRIPPELRDLALSFPHTLNLTQCRTKSPEGLAELIDGLKIKIDALETHGGMGRIYALRDPSKVLKVADVRTSWCKFEPRNYRVLRECKVPCATVHASLSRKCRDTAYILLLLERLEFTMTAFIRALGRTSAHPTIVSGMLQDILRLLRENDLVFGDLSPDNIMFRSLGGHVYELALVDPQFLVRGESFRKVLGHTRGTAFDTTYLALKVQAIGLLDPPVAKFTNAVCAKILGHLPAEKHTRYWLLHEAPTALFVAYDILNDRPPSRPLISSSTASSLSASVPLETPETFRAPPS